MLNDKNTKWQRLGPWSDNPGDDSRSAHVGRALTPDLKGAWRTPSLRNVALTAPYMHDGRYATLQDVVWHYSTGGEDAGPEQVGDRAAEIKPLRLTDSEVADLVAFMETLTGRALASDLTVASVPVPVDDRGTTGAGGTGGIMGTGAGGAPSP